MESLRHHRSPGSERFLGVFSPPPPDASAGVELHESDILWTSTPDVSDPTPAAPTSSIASPSPFPSASSRAALRRPPDRGFGILAALPEDDGGGSSVAPPILQRKTSMSSALSSASSSASNSPSSLSTTRAIPAIPKPKLEYALSMPAGRMHQAQSLPVNVPVVPRRMRRFEVEDSLGADDRDGDEHEMMPPHEIVARSNGRRSDTTFSMLEGAGRTLKGRDLRRVRDAVFRQTGFLD